MHVNPRAALVASVGTAVVVAAGFAFLHRPVAGPKAATAIASANARPAPRLACRFSVGDEAGFALTERITAKGTPDPKAADSFDAILRTRVIEVPRQGEWLVGAAFVKASLTQSLTDAELRVTEPIEAPFLVRFDESCRFVAVGLPRAWKVTSRRFVWSIVRGLEVAVPAGRPGRSYSMQQRDALGPYLATYEAGDALDGVVPLRRRKNGYSTPPNAPPGTKIEVLASDTKVGFDAAGAWLRSFDTTESVRLESQGQVIAELTSAARLERNDTLGSLAWPPPAFSLENYDWSDPFDAPLETGASPELDPRLLAMSFDDAIAEFARLYAGDGKPDSYHAAVFLGDWLKAHPEQAATVMSAVREKKLTDGQRASAFLALQRCGTEQARAVLISGLRDRRLSGLDRARAASALSDVPKPTDEAFRALLAESRHVPSGKDGEAQMVAATSVRALGHLGERTEKSDPALHDNVRGELSRMLDSAGDGARAVDVLDAIGNSGDERFAKRLETKLSTDPSPMVREHAARAYRHMNAASARDALQSALTTETDPAVRAALADTLAHVIGGGQQAAPSDVSAAVAALAEEADPNARASLIRLLGPAAATSPLAKQALIAAFHRETVPELQRLIGKYLTVADLQ
jgi:HEAT repeat protein